MPHRRSGGGPLQTARVGLRERERGGGIDSQWQGEKELSVGTRGQLLGSPADTHGCNPLQLAAETASEGHVKGGFNAAVPFHSHERTNTDSIHEDDILRRCWWWWWWLGGGGRTHTI